MKRTLFQEFSKGLSVSNPVFGLVLGLCPALAVSTSVSNAIGMSAAVIFVLTCSNIIISSIKRLIPKEIRLPCFIVVIATFVTIVELVLHAYFPNLRTSLGIFVPLIVVNCIILGRAEAFACRNTVMRSMFDGLGMGVGFSFSLIIISVIREVLGTGEILGIPVLAKAEPALFFVLAPGALFTLGVLIAISNHFRYKRGQTVKLKGGCH
ncbi:MAG: electron transport complex subunit E [Candidatus Omnitrophica bacterium]|nr:electron transport complex subunit E [Candidatus Omnitrophota bacterium]